MTVTVKQGEKVDTIWTASGFDLTGCTVELRARLATAADDAAFTELATTVPDPETGEVHHKTTGALEPGDYDIDLHVTTGAGDVAVFRPAGRTYDTLRVLPSL
jgi:hypothetical protein